MIETSKKEYSTTIPTTRQEMEEFIEDLFRPEVETEIEIARTNQQIKKSLDVASSVNICPICLEPENLPRCIECGEIIEGELRYCIRCEGSKLLTHSKCKAEK